MEGCFPLDFRRQDAIHRVLEAEVDQDVEELICDVCKLMTAASCHVDLLCLDNFNLVVIVEVLQIVHIHQF